MRVELWEEHAFLPRLLSFMAQDAKLGAACNALQRIFAAKSCKEPKTINHHCAEGPSHPFLTSLPFRTSELVHTKPLVDAACWGACSSKLKGSSLLLYFACLNLVPTPRRGVRSPLSLYDPLSLFFSLSFSGQLRLATS